MEQNSNINESFVLNMEHQNEPTISVITSDNFCLDEAFISHEIIDKSTLNCRILNTEEYLEQKYKKRKQNLSINSQDSLLIKNKKRKKEEDNVLCRVLKKIAIKNESNCSDMKMMINSDTGQYVMKTNCASYKISKDLQLKKVKKDLSDEKLFILKQSKALDDSLSSSKTSSEIEPQLDSLSRSKEEQTIISDEKRLKDNSQILYWEEGNIDKITKYISLSEKLKEQNIAFHKNKFKKHHSFMEDINDFGNFETTTNPKLEAAPGVIPLLSMDAVKTKIEEIEEETMTKFNSNYRTPNFFSDPQPFKKIYFELNTMRKGVPVVIPNTGIPFIFLGITVYSCHLGKKKNCKAKNTVENNSQPLKSKKIGCPALLSVARIARFPDFCITGLPVSTNSGATEEVISELKDAWDFSSAFVRFYIQYHLRPPPVEDHHGHEVQFMENSSRFKEPVDPRVLAHMRESARNGITSVRVMQPHVAAFVRSELFGGQTPPLDRRRYNPTVRDIRYAIDKAKDEMRVEGKSVAQAECAAALGELGNLIGDVRDESYLHQLKSVLEQLTKVARSRQPLQSAMLARSVGSRSMPKSSRRIRAPEISNATPTVAVSESGDLSAAAAESISELCHSVGETLYSAVAHGSGADVNAATAGVQEEAVFNEQLYVPTDFDVTGDLAEALRPGAQSDAPIPQVYYFYPDGVGNSLAV